MLHVISHQLLLVAKKEAKLFACYINYENIRVNVTSAFSYLYYRLHFKTLIEYETLLIVPYRFQKESAANPSCNICNFETYPKKDCWCELYTNLTTQTKTEHLS